MIIGQEKLCKRIDNSNLDTFPRSLMLVGEEGSGKHLLCERISKHLRLPIEDITESLTLETINDIYVKAEPTIYTIIANKISVKEENIILKFLEEPLSNAYIILIADTDIGLLQTVVNRCNVWQLQHYTKEVLMTFVGDADPAVLEVAHTPGLVKKMLEQPYKDMLALSEKIIDKIEVATISNTLTLSNKLAFKDEKNKFDVDAFISILLNVASKKYRTNSDNKFVTAYLLTSELKKNLHIPNIDKKALFEKYLVTLRSCMRGGVA